MREKYPSKADPNSKSGKKRAQEVIQKLTKELVDLKDGEFAALEIDADLRDEIQVARDLKSPPARRRQLRYLAHQVADGDVESLQAALDKLKAGKRSDAEDFQKLEILREQIVAGDESTVLQICADLPNCDPKNLRKLQLQSQAELKVGKSVTAARALFRYLRQVSKVQIEAPTE